MQIGIIIVIVFISVWALGIFLGIIGGFSKSFTHTPSGMDSSEVKTQEQKIIDDTEEKRQKMMDDIKQKMEDSKHRF